VSVCCGAIVARVALHLADGDHDERSCGGGASDRLGRIRRILARYLKFCDSGGGAISLGREKGRGLGEKSRLRSATKFPCLPLQTFFLSHFYSR